MSKKQRWLVVSMKVLLVSPHSANVMAVALHFISHDEDIDSAGTYVECVVSNDYSNIKKKDYNDVNELYAELPCPSEAIMELLARQ